MFMGLQLLSPIKVGNKKGEYQSFERNRFPILLLRQRDLGGTD
jgi:hypothetical protein